MNLRVGMKLQDRADGMIATVTFVDEGGATLVWETGGRWRMAVEELASWQWDGAPRLVAVGGIATVLSLAEAMSEALA